MRRILSGIYVGSGWIAALFLVLTCATVLLQVGCNLLGSVLEWTLGVHVSLLIPSYAEFAGYFFAAMAFFGLGYAYHSRTHIRVSLLLDRLSDRMRVVCEFFCVVVAVVLSGVFTFHAFALTISSFDFGDLSVGLVPIPMWIPQAAMACGMLVITIATLDDLFGILLGYHLTSPPYRGDESNSEAAGSDEPVRAPNVPSGATVQDLALSEAGHLRPRVV